MHKYILFFCALLCAGMSAQAQSSLPNDIIITLERELLHVKVLKVGINEVEYLKADNLEGPLHVMAKKDIISIRYANGSMDVFNETANNALPKQPKPTAPKAPVAETPTTENLPTKTPMAEIPPTATTAVEVQAGNPPVSGATANEAPATVIPPSPQSIQKYALPSILTTNGYDYYLDGVRISNRDAKQWICSSSYQGMYYWKKARRNAGWGWTLAVLGALDLCSAGILIGSGNAWNPLVTKTYDGFYFTTANNGILTLIEGVAFTAGAIVCLSRVKPARRMAVKSYNEAIQEKHRASLELVPASNGLGLGVRF